MRSFGSAQFQGGRDVEKELIRLHRRFMSNSRRQDRAVWMRRFLLRGSVIAIGATAGIMIYQGLATLLPGLPPFALELISRAAAS
jgi:hypothetical protein